MKQSRADQVAGEDVVTFIHACFACTGQREFYSDPRGQQVALAFLHQYVLGNYRRLYARALAAGINDFNKALVIAQLLAAGAPADLAQRREENALLHAALRSLPPHRALRLLASLRAHRVNNRRSRALARRYLAELRDPSFTCVKYRHKVHDIARHAHLRCDALSGNPELGRFLFARRGVTRFATPLFEQLRAAMYAREAIFDLPFTIAEGLAAKHRVARDTLLERMAPRMTAQEKLRVQGSAERADAEVAADYGRIAITKLASYVLSLDPKDRDARRAELTEALGSAATRLLRRTPRTLGRVAAVLDRSYSSSGSHEKRRRPLAIALASSVLLRAAAREYRAFWTPSHDDELTITAMGQTDLATPLLAALAWKPDLVVIVSDGYENDPPCGAAEVARAWRERLDPEGSVSIVHANPVFDPQLFAPRSIGRIPTVALRGAEDLPLMLGFVRFADGSAPLTELLAYLDDRVDAMLSEHV